MTRLGRLRLYTDASWDPASRQGFGSLVLVGPGGVLVEEAGSLGVGPGSGWAEYAAALWVLEHLLRSGFRRCRPSFCTDHQALFRQLFRLVPPPVRADLVRLFRAIRNRLDRFDEHECVWIERQSNLADGACRALVRSSRGQAKAR